MHFLLHNIILSIALISSVHGLFGSQNAKYDHEEKHSNTYEQVNVFLKGEELDKLKHDSLYELVGVDFDLLPDDVRDNWLSNIHYMDKFPKLGKKDKLNLRALNREYRKKFILVLDGYTAFDLDIDGSDVSRKLKASAIDKLNTTKYPYNNKNEFVLDDHDAIFDDLLANNLLSLKNPSSQITCDLMKEGLLEVTGFNFKNKNNYGFSVFVNAVKHTPTVWLSSLDAGYAAELARLLPENSHIRSIGISHGAKSKEDQQALKEIIKKNTGLKKLYLRDGSVDDEGASAIAEALENNSSVTHIDLCGNAITGHGAKAFTKMLKRNKTLKDLDLYGNKLELKDLMELQKDLEQNKTLDRMCVGGNNFYKNPSDPQYQNTINRVQEILKKDPRIYE